MNSATKYIGVGIASIGFRFKGFWEYFSGFLVMIVVCTTVYMAHLFWGLVSRVQRGGLCGL